MDVRQELGAWSQQVEPALGPDEFAVSGADHEHEAPPARLAPVGDSIVYRHSTDPSRIVAALAKLIEWRAESMRDEKAPGDTAAGEVQPDAAAQLSAYVYSAGVRNHPCARMWPRRLPLSSSHEQTAASGQEAANKEERDETAPSPP